jgi:DNA polymerase V
VGRGIAAKLEARGIYTMGDVARTSLTDEELFYRLFGVNAELLIYHAWGYEPCTMEDIKAYKPDSTSLGSGQVLHCAYGYDKARLIVREMIDTLSLDLVEKGLCTDQIVLSVGYDIDNLKDGGFDGEVSLDFYGRRVPKMAHGTATLPRKSSSTKDLTDATLDLFDRIVDKKLSVRRINLTAGRLVKEDEYHAGEQLDMLSLLTDGDSAHEEREIKRKKERKIQSAVLDIKKKYGKNSIIKGMNLEDGATAKDRNEQIGGHKA